MVHTNNVDSAYKISQMQKGLLGLDNSTILSLDDGSAGEMAVDTTTCFSFP